MTCRHDFFLASWFSNLNGQQPDGNVIFRQRDCGCLGRADSIRKRTIRTFRATRSTTEPQLTIELAGP